MERDLSDLSSEQLRALQEFRDIAQTDDIGGAVNLLERESWDVQAAVDTFFRNLSTEANMHQDSLRDERAISPSSAGATRYLQWLFQSVPTALNPDEDFRAFESSFEQTYGSNHPSFFQGSYTKAVAHAYHNTKLLLVYLHSPLHADTSKFCRQSFCSPTFNQLADNRLVVWGGSTDHAEAYNLSQVLRATRFPFLALLVSQSERSVQLITRIQGYHNEADLTSRIQNALNTQSSTLERMSADRSMRNESSALRGEQDREYMEALEEDRRIMARKEQEKREREEQAEASRHQAELESALELSRTLDKQNRIEKLRESNRIEPSPGPDVANIKFQLPDGKKITRNFIKTDNVEDLRNYLEIYLYDNQINMPEFSVSTNYPKRVLCEKTEKLDEAGLYPRGVLFVQNLES